MQSAAGGSSPGAADNDIQSNYWNIDDILCEEELIPCKFHTAQNNLGFLTNTLAQNNKGSNKKKQDQPNMILEGTKADLPLWLAALMSTRGIVELLRPIFLTKAYFD